MQHGGSLFAHMVVDVDHDWLQASKSRFVHPHSLEQHLQYNSCTVKGR